MALVVVLHDLINDLSPPLDVRVCTAWEQNSVKLAQPIHRYFFRFIPDERDHTCTGSLHKFDVCSHDVRVVAVESGIVVEVRIEALRNDTDDRLLVEINVGRNSFVEAL